MSVRLVPKSMTLNDVEQRNGVILRYFSEQRILVASGLTAYKFTFAISSPDEFLFYFLIINILVFLPSVLWCCWLGSRKGIRPVKTEW